ncbi:MAG: 4-oxalocrotonate tautomerase family protein [Armatimonadota bacterium]
MPIVTVRLAKGRDIATKRAVVEAVTNAVVSTLNVRPEWVTVLLEELDRENWSTGGELHIDKFGEGFGEQGVGKPSR